MSFIFSKISTAFWILDFGIWDFGIPGQPGLARAGPGWPRQAAVKTAAAMEAAACDELPRGVQARSTPRAQGKNIPFGNPSLQYRAQIGPIRSLLHPFETS